MKAWQVARHGEPEDILELADIPRPAPGPGQIQVRVLAAAANFPDVLLCRGVYQVKMPLPFTLGVELCGEVTETGPDVCGLAPGDRVIGDTALPHGAFAEYAVMDASAALPAPPALDDAEAAPFYVTYETCWLGLHRRARLQAGETLLVHAAAGGVGTGAIQVGKAAGARVIGVVGGPGKVALAREAGADVVVDRAHEDFVAVVREVTGGKGADVVFDPVGGDVFHKSTKCVAFEGRIVVVGFTSGIMQSAALNHALVKNYDILGLQGRTYRFLESAAIRDHYAALLKLTETGEIKTVVTERLTLADVPDGLRRLGAGSTTGRIVFVP
ncbi:MAG TPA: NADPH:quinone oxidoreductase family protein [Trebonia sp.]|nr:NADPH:quinone oxidoreductase family protein [Trebonia sp.]